VSRLDEIRERLAKATKGPWTIKYQENNENWLVINGPDAVAEVMDWSGMPGNSNAKFIAHSRADVEALLKMVDVLAYSLEEFGEHKHDCIRSFISAGRPTESGGYELCVNGEWFEKRPVDKTPKCECGFDNALALGHTGAGGSDAKG
jgi:hypothetical protein